MASPPDKKRVLPGPGESPVAKQARADVIELLDSSDDDESCPGAGPGAAAPPGAMYAAALATAQGEATAAKARAQSGDEALARRLQQEDDDAATAAAVKSGPGGAAGGGRAGPGAGTGGPAAAAGGYAPVPDGLRAAFRAYGQRPDVVVANAAAAAAGGRSAAAPGSSMIRLPASCCEESEFCENPGLHGALAAGGAAEGGPPAKLKAILLHLFKPIADDPICYFMGGGPRHPSDSEVVFQAIPAMLLRLGLLNASTDRAMHEAVMKDVVTQTAGGDLSNLQGNAKYEGGGKVSGV